MKLYIIIRLYYNPINYVTVNDSLYYYKIILYPPLILFPDPLITILYIFGIDPIFFMFVFFNLNIKTINKCIFIYLLVFSILIIIMNIFRLYLLHKFFVDNQKGKNFNLFKALPKCIII